MTANFDEEALRNWLADYLVTNIGCSPDEIDFDASVNDLGVGSRDAVVLSGELSELLGRPVSPVEFWQHPTIDGLARFLSGSESDADAEPVLEPDWGSMDEPIAVIGLGCRFPGEISGPDALWQFLCEGRSAVQEVPPNRWAPFDDGSPAVADALARTTRWGSFLTDIDAFDAEFFDISLREAAKMDPQQRLLLEVAWEALEQAGIPPSSLRRSQTGVFVGASIAEYGYLASTDLPAVDAWSNSGGALSIIANRLSYFLDLRGPSVTVDTACSSSLVALHLACQSLRMQDSDVAIAGGVNLLLSPAVFRGFDQSGALSPTGSCHAFDADADGFVRGEGCGVVVLKRLSDALRDGDRLLAVVLGSAVNQDGRSNGLLAPNPAAQMAVLRSAYANAGVPPHEVDYVETHGTGTLLGDPIEARALGKVLGRGRPEQSPLLIGAVKTNLGHLEAAAGMAGFIKAVLAVNRGSIPKNLHFQTPNPHIPFDQLRLKVVADQQKWPSVGRPRRAGVSSFGFGGTNAHVVIEQAPASQPVVGEPDPAVSTLVVSGSTPERIASMAGVLADWMDGDGHDVTLPDVAHTLNHHRTLHAQFATVCARDRAQAVAGLQALAAGRSADGVVGPHDGSCRPGTVFVYSGQGSHWAGMGRQLLVDELVFARAVAELEPVFVEQVGFSLWQVIARGEPVRGDAQVQPALMGLQLGLTELWCSYGVHPDAVIGHSMGEVTAAVVAGALTVADGLRVIATRSQLMSQLAGQGAVALLNLDAEATAALIADYPEVSLAGYVSPRQTVIAGPAAPVDSVIAAVSGQNRFARRVNMEVASHTALMDPILPDLRAALADLTPGIPTIPFFSTVVEDTTLLDGKPLLDAEYWAANVRQPARLSQAIAAAAQDHATFIEISAHPILTHAVSDTLESVTHHHSVGTLWRDGDDTVSFHTNLNATHTNLPPQTPHLPEPHPGLPTTPWHHTRHWSDFTPVRHRHESVEPGADWSAQTGGTIPVEWYCKLAWPARELSGAQADVDSWWLVVADSELGAGIGRVLGDDSRVTVLPPSMLAEDADNAALADALAGVTHVLYAPQVGYLDAESGYGLFNAARRLTAVVASMALPPRLFLLTRIAQPVGDGDRANPVHAVLWGLGRTLALEHPEIWGGIIDVDESVPAGLAAKYVVDEAHGGDGEDQVVYRAGVRRVPRLQRGHPPPAAPVELDKDSSHLVIGATGNIGPYLIRQLADMGAATIVAVSRHPGSRLDELATSLSEKGTTLVTVAADTTDAAGMAALFDRFGADLPPLHGIYLAAFGGGPVTLADMTDDDVAAMFRPKLDAVSLLHNLSLHHPVRQFVVFSSISGLTGSRWLAHYAATTTFLDTFAYARRAAGLSATAVNWGLWKSLTDSQTDQERQVTLDSGLEPMPDEVAIQALRLVTGPGAPVRSTVVAADWTRLATAYRSRAALHIVDDLLPTEDDTTSSTNATEFRAALRDCEPTQRRDLLVDHVRTQVAAAMGLASRQSLDPSAGFFQSGMDSLMSVTLQRSLSESLGEALPASVVFDYPTVDALAGYLATIIPELVEVADSESVDAYDSARLEIAEKGDTEPIAVVGMGCRLPGGVNNPAQYWQLLRDGASGIVRVPKDRWDVDAYYSADYTVPGTICSRDGGFLTSWQPDEFDAEFFGISPREATGMDPQHRLLLEVAWEALENAGITAQAIRGSQTSVFVGVTTNDYSLSLARRLQPEDSDPYISFGNASNFAAGRLAYFLGVHGPAVVIDTACSSSLVTVHLACQSLRRRESDQALAAGVNLILSPENSIACSRWGMLAPDGRCKTFDVDADGYVRSEGAGVVVLKRLSDALRDGDSVLAVVRGSAVNQDGPSSGQTVPNGPAQQAVLRQALAASRLAPADIDYVEAHGTGTALGDPIELDALSQVFSERDGSAPLVLGSVKTNLGHLESAAGIAGFIKTVLSVRHGYIPQHLNFNQLTSHASAGASRFTIAAQPMQWPTVGRARRAGVSSFGVSGTNAHVVVEQAPDTEPVAPQPEPVVSTLVISGKTPARIASTAAMLADWVTGEGAGVPLADVAHTANHHRTRHKHVAAVCARDRAQAVTGLQALATGHTAVGVVDAHQGPHGSGTVFVYSGQGSQWAGMGRRLLADEPAFAAAIVELESVFVEQVGFSLRQVLDSGEQVVGIDRIQPVLVGMQLALTVLWRSYGVEPDAVIGHSMGEVTAAVVAGALTPAEGLRVIATRSRLMSRLSGQGAMALLELEAPAAEKLIADYPDVTVAVYASPSQTVIAGPPEQVDAVIAVVDAQGRLARRIEVDVASHHPTIDPILPELRSALSGLAPVAPKIPLISTTGHAGSEAPRFDADYWVTNLRNPVRFSQAVAAAGADHATFVEVSPHPLLTYAITDTLQSTSSTNSFIVTSALKRVEDETLFFHAQLAALGVTAPNAGGGRFADIPPSPWLHSRYWVASRSLAQRLPDTHPLLGVHVEMPSGRDHVWQADIGTEMMPSLADHKVHGQAVMSAAGFAEMALAAGCQALGLPVHAIQVNELEVEQLLALDRQTRVTTQLAQSDDGIRVEIHASSAGGSWSRYAVASIAVTHGDGPAKRPEPPVEAGSGWLETEIVLPDDAADHPRYCIHPVMLDAALQSLVAAVPAELLKDPTETAYLPASLATIRVFGQVGRRARCRTELVSLEHEGAGHLGRIMLMDDTGTPTAELTGVELRRIDPGTVSLPLEQKIFDTAWVETSMPSEVGQEISAAPAGSWLLLADGDAETKALVAEFAARFSSPIRRVISEELSDESAVLEAVAKTAADPELPAVGMIVFVGKRSFDGTDPDGALRRARELIWAISVAARAAVDGWHGKSPRLWLITRNGLAVHGDEPGDPAIGALKGLIRNWRFPGEAARVLADEPDLGATLVDLDCADDVVAAFLSELESPASDDVIARRAELRYVERLSRATLDAGERDAVVRADGSYIITGGLGGLGMVVVRWLVEHGAGRLILNGRTDPSDGQRRDLADLANGAEIVFVSGDIASAGVAERLVVAAEETGRPLRGVVHAAGVTGDGIVAALTQEGMERVWAPKVAGALRLHAATVTRQLDWWVGFSSMASLLGLPGQLAYTTANAWLDALVAWRRASGLPATAIGWGQWSDVGMSRSLTYSVLDPITPDEGIEALESLVGGNLTRVGVGRMRLDRAIAAIPEFRELGYFERVVEEFDTSSVDDRSTVNDRDRFVAPVRDWSQIPAENRSSELTIRLRAILARELRMPASAVDVDQPFPELGLDSMMAMTVLKETQQLAGIDLSASMLWNHPTISSLAAYLAEMLAPQQVAPEGRDEGGADLTLDSSDSVLDELFDSVESASAGSESGSF